jgi:hypothetical protein
MKLAGCRPSVHRTGGRPFLWTEGVVAVTRTSEGSIESQVWVGTAADTNGQMPERGPEERRRSVRRAVNLLVRLTRGPEQPCALAETVDVSHEGLLIRLSEPGTPLCRGDRVLLSFDEPDGALHLLAGARRSERGADGRWYVAVEFDEVEPLDRSRLDQLLELDRTSRAPLSRR